MFGALVRALNLPMRWLSRGYPRALPMFTGTVSLL